MAKELPLLDERGPHGAVMRLLRENYGDWIVQDCLSYQLVRKSSGELLLTLNLVVNDGHLDNGQGESFDQAFAQTFNRLVQSGLITFKTQA